MTDNLLKLRPLALLLVLIGYAVYVLITLIGTIGDGLDFGFLNVFGSVGPNLLSSFFPVVLAVLLILAAVVKPEVPQPRLRTLALGSLIVSAVALGLGALFTLLGIFGDGILRNLRTFVTAAALATISAVAFLVILRVFSGLPRPVPAVNAYGQPGQQQPGPMGQQGPLSVGQWGGQGGQAPGGQPPNAPVWQPDQAVGASWGTAQDAAAGNAGTWGGQGQSGWQPQAPQQQPQQAQQQPQHQQQPQAPQQPQGSQQSWGAPPQQPGGYPQSQPSAGWQPQEQQPSHEPSAGYPASQPSAGYPASQPSAGYPASQPSSSQPEPQQSAWEDDLDDRTRLTPRVQVDPPTEQQDPPQRPW